VQVVVGPQRRDERRLVDEVGASGVDEDERGSGSRQPGTVDDDEAAGGMQADDVAVGGQRVHRGENHPACTGEVQVHPGVGCQHRGSEAAQPSGGRLTDPAEAD